jgi:hypothetical protein
MGIGMQSWKPLEAAALQALLYSLPERLSRASSPEDATKLMVMGLAHIYGVLDKAWGLSERGAGSTSDPSNGNAAPTLPHANAFGNSIYRFLLELATHPEVYVPRELRAAAAGLFGWSVRSFRETMGLAGLHFGA